MFGSLGWSEILFVFVIALIIFGPRKLPELGKSLGQSLAQFKKASEDFKRSWEEEVEQEKHKLTEAASIPAQSVESVVDEAKAGMTPTDQETRPLASEQAGRPAASETPKEKWL